MNKSDSIANLATSLSQAQGEFKPASMSTVNKFLLNKYADLGEVIKAASPTLAKFGLCISQPVADDGERVSVTTLLMHKSGEWLESTISMPVGEEKGKSRAQVIGSIITYLRRYGYSAMVGMYSDEDDDGNDKKRENAKTTPPTALHNAPEPTQTVTPPPATNGKLARPLAPETVRDGITRRTHTYELDNVTCTDQDRNMIAANINLMFAGQERVDDIRHAVLKYLTGNSSAKDLSAAQVVALKKWIDAKPDSGGEYQPNADSITEARSIWTAALKEAGQEGLGI